MLDDFNADHELQTSHIKHVNESENHVSPLSPGWWWGVDLLALMLSHECKNDFQRRHCSSSSLDCLHIAGGHRGFTSRHD